MRRRTRRHDRDERGSILILSTVGLVLALIATSLAVDTGFLAHEVRIDQKVADLAALDAVRVLPTDPTVAARASALRNGFPTGPGYSVTAVEGVKIVNGSGNDVCQAQAGAGSVCVTATSPHQNYFPFVAGGQSKNRVAVASNTAFGGFFIGSSLVTIDTKRAGLLNNFVGRMLKGSALSLSLVSWQGLATGKVTLSALKTQLAGMGFSVGTTSQLLSAGLTAAQLLQATAQALTAQGDLANATVLNTIRTQITNTTQITLGQFIQVAQGAENTALAANLNVFQLLTAAAEVANGSNFVSVPDVSITVPGVSATDVTLQIIEPPQFYFGPVGGSRSTGQISLTARSSLNLNVPLGVASAVVTGGFPVKVTAAGATGTLAAATCGASSGITVTVDPIAFSGSIATTLNARVSTIVPVADVAIPLTSTVPTTNGGPTNLAFNYPTEFPPPAGTTTTKHAGSQPIGLSGLTTLTPGTPVVTLLGALPLPLPVGQVVTGVVAALGPVLADVDNLVLTPLLQALGIDVGSADVTAFGLTCAVPTLSG